MGIFSKEGSITISSKVKVGKSLRLANKRIKGFGCMDSFRTKCNRVRKVLLDLSRGRFRRS